MSTIFAKTTGNIAPATASFTEHNTIGPPYATKLRYVDYSFKGTSGDSIPGYHGKIRRGELLPITRWYQFESNSTYWGGRQYKNTNGAVYTQAYPSTNQWNHPDARYSVDDIYLASFLDPDMCDNVATRAYVALTSTTHDSLTFVAELGKTVSMFRGVAHRLVDLLGRTSPKQWANAWLEGRYGWRTLSYDMKSVAEAIEELDKRSEFYKARAYSSQTVNDSISSTWTSIDSTLQNTWDASITCEYRGLAVGKLKPPSFGGDLVVTAWELVPFSFVIDWFLDIGLTLQALTRSHLVGSTSIGCGTKVTCTGTSNTTILSQSHTGFYQYIYNDAGATINATLLQRGSQSLSFTPSWNPRLDEFKVADLIALVIQALSK